MATIRITRYEIEQNLLPAVCVFTGEPTTDTVRHLFRWMPHWVPFVLLGSTLLLMFFRMVFAGVGMDPPCIAYALPGLGMVFGTVGLAGRKAFVIDLPLVSRESLHWFWPRAFETVGGMTCIAALILGSTNSDAINGLKSDFDYGLMAERAGAVGFVAVGIVAYFWRGKTLRALEITDTDMILAGVHPNFVAALQEEWAKEIERRKSRTAAHREWREEREEGRRARRVPQRTEEASTPESDLDVEKFLLQCAADELEEAPPGPETRGSPQGPPAP